MFVLSSRFIIDTGTGCNVHMYNNNRFFLLSFATILDDKEIAIISKIIVWNDFRWWNIYKVFLCVLLFSRHLYVSLIVNVIKENRHFHAGCLCFRKTENSQCLKRTLASIAKLLVGTELCCSMASHRDMLSFFFFLFFWYYISMSSDLWNQNTRLNRCFSVTVWKKK